MELTTAELRDKLANKIYPDGLRVYGKMAAEFADMEVDKNFDDPKDMSQTCILDEEGEVLSRKTYREYLIIIGENEDSVIARLCTKDFATGNLIISGGLKSPELEALCQIVPIDCIYCHEDALVEASKLRGNDELDY